MSRILIVGLGTVGTALRASAWLSRHQVVAASRYAPDALRLDIGSRESVEDFFKKNGPFDIVINCAAEANVDACESDPQAARRVNALGVRWLAESCARTRAGLIHLSTDYVFDGNGSRPYMEDDAVGPCSIYGMTKLEGERYAMTIPEYSAVIRTTWIFGGTRTDFVNGIIDKMKRGETPGVVDDQAASPAYAPDLAETLGTIGEVFLLPARQKGQGVNRVFHCTNRGETTRHGMAVRIAQRLKRSADIPRLASKDIPTWVAVRPRYTVMSINRIEKEFGLKMRSWEEALDHYLTVKR